MTMSNPGTCFATSSDAFSTVLPVVLVESRPEWKSPTVRSGRSVSFICFTHFDAVDSMSSKRSPLHRFSGSQPGMAGVSNPITAIRTPSRSMTV